MSQRVSPTKIRLAAAFVVAAVSDLVSGVTTLVPPIEWAIDLSTALLLFLLLGRQWLILPGLIAEAIPGLAIFPFWILVVGSIAIWGTIRRPSRGEVVPNQTGIPPRLPEWKDPPKGS